MLESNSKEKQVWGRRLKTLAIEIDMFIKYMRVRTKRKKARARHIEKNAGLSIPALLKRDIRIDRGCHEEFL